MSTRSELKALRREYGDLLESHGGRRLEEFKRYAKDPVAFIREVLKAQLDYGDVLSAALADGNAVVESPPEYFDLSVKMGHGTEGVI